MEAAGSQGSRVRAPRSRTSLANRFIMAGLPPATATSMCAVVCVCGGGRQVATDVLRRAQKIGEKA
jgi:hypothetical protein